MGTAFHAMQLSAIRSHSRSFSENSAENSGCRSSISSTLRRHSRTKALHGTYLPPEMDPEYRNVYKPTAKLRPVNSTTALGADLLPLPKVGDLVKYEGRWKDEETVGRIRYLNYIEDYKAWYADIVPLKPGVAADDIYIIDRNSRAEYLPTDQIVPIKSSYVRAENAYRVYFDKAGPTTGSTEKPTKALSVKAPAYRTIEKDTPLRNKVRSIC